MVREVNLHKQGLTLCNGSDPVEIIPDITERTSSFSPALICTPPFAYLNTELGLRTSL